MRPTGDRAADASEIISEPATQLRRPRVTKTEPASAESIEPAPTEVLPPRSLKVTLPTVAASLLDGFEGPEHSVWAFDAADDEADALYTSEGKTQGERALKLSLRKKGAKGKLHLRREVDLDLSDASGLLLDVTAPNDKFSIALAMKCEPGDAYQESRPLALNKGLNRGVRFELESKTWKNEKTNWQYNGPPVNLRGVTRLVLLVFTGSESEGSLLLDNLQVEGISADAALKKIPRTVYREWRPEFLALTPPPQGVNQYDTFEIQAVFSASYRDIFDPHDLTFGVRVQTPSGRKLDTRGFFGGLVRHKGKLLHTSDKIATKPLWGPIKTDKKDGEKAAPDQPEKDDAGEEQVLPLWLLRFTPQETGRYTFQFYLRNSVGETRTVEHATVVAPSFSNPQLPGRKGGNVRVSRNDPRQLELQDGSPFFIFGQNVCWTQDWQPYFQKMKAYGGNTMRVWLCPWGLNLERKTEPGAYDLAVAERIDQLMQLAESNGVRIIFCFSFHGLNQDFWHEQPYNQANGGPCARREDFFTDSRARSQFKRLLSYSIARWGSSPALLSWELMNEMDLAAFDQPEDVANWAREMAGHIKTTDAHNHLVTTSVTKPSFLPELWNDSRIDFISVHGYGTDVTQLVYDYAAPFRSINKPYLLAEFGGGTHPGDDIPDKDGARLQSALWLTACSQSCGAALPWWWDTYIEARDLYPLFAATNKFIVGDDRRGRYSEWVRKPLANGVEVTGSMDSQGARLYVHHPGWTKAPETRGATLLADAIPLKLKGLVSGTYAVSLWDVRDGTVFANQNVAVSDGVLTIELPKRAREFGIKADRKTLLRPGLE